MATFRFHYYFLGENRDAHRINGKRNVSQVSQNAKRLIKIIMDEKKDSAQRLFFGVNDLKNRIAIEEAIEKEIPFYDLTEKQYFNYSLNL